MNDSIAPTECNVSLQTWKEHDSCFLVCSCTCYLSCKLWPLRPGAQAWYEGWCPSTDLYSCSI